jgi:hypothetical protein
LKGGDLCPVCRGFPRRACAVRQSSAKEASPAAVHYDRRDGGKAGAGAYPAGELARADTLLVLARACLRRQTHVCLLGGLNDERLARMRRFSSPASKV